MNAANPVDRKSHSSLNTLSVFPLQLTTFFTNEAVMFYLGSLWVVPCSEESPAVPGTLWAGLQSRSKPGLARNEVRCTSLAAQFAGRVRIVAAPFSTRRVKTCLLPRGYRTPGRMAYMAKHVDSTLLITAPCVVYISLCWRQTELLWSLHE